MDLVASAAATAERLLVTLPRRWAHVQAVAARAAELVEVLAESDRSAVVAAAWLHDVGYAPDIAATGFHPLDGARFVASQGDFADVVAQLVAHHTGATVEAIERGLGEELATFPAPPRRLLDVVTAADVLTGPDGLPVKPAERVAEILRRYPEDDPVHRAVAQSGPGLIATANRVLARLADVRLGAASVGSVGDPQSH
jgi:hypothetical protein